MNASREPEILLQGGEPIHRQISDQIRSCIVAGLLEPGEQLPTVRALAVALAVNPGAVRRAYARLEAGGLLNTRDGSGVYVAGRRDHGDRPRRLRRLCDALLDRAAAEGYNPQQVLNTVRTLIRRRIQS